MCLSHATRRGFSIIELLVTLGIIGFLIALLLPSLCRSREGGNRVKCASNLRQIGLAMGIYANENHGHFPRTRFDEVDFPVPVFYTHPTAAQPFAVDGPAPNDVTAAIYLLARIADLNTEVVICPSSSGERSTRDLTKTSNFSDPINLFYSYNNPYPSKAARDAGFEVNSKLPAQFVVMADINPGGGRLLTTRSDASRRELQFVNSPNHGGDGQNVLYADLHVEFQNSPFVGMTRAATGQSDNIYTAGGTGTSRPESIAGAAADPNDTILLPALLDMTLHETPAQAQLSVGREMGVRGIVWVWAGTAAAMAVVLLITAKSIRSRRNLAMIAGAPVS